MDTLDSQVSAKLSKSGDSMSGKLTLPVSTTATAPLNMPHGSAPASPANGDVWTTTASVQARINGTSRTLYHDGNAATAALTTATQAEAEAGTATTVRAWTPERVRQASVSANAAAITASGTWANFISNPFDLNIVAGLGFIIKEEQ